MENTHEFILTIGGILLLGLAIDVVGKRTHLPRVTLLLLFGYAIGVNGLDIVPTMFIENYGVIADVTLIMIGFLVGGKLTRKVIRNQGVEVVLITTFSAVITACIVALGLLLIGLSLELSVLLGCISSATAPAATLDVIIESRKKGQFIDRLVTIVALDDLFGLILFSLGLTLLSTGTFGMDSIGHSLYDVVREIVGAFLLGIIIGFPATYLTGKVKPGQPLLIEAIGLILICGGLALWMNVSHLIAAIVMGAVVANFAKHHEYSFHEIENVEWPFLVLFFTLAGASLKYVSIESVFTVMLLYIVLRVIGKLLGTYIGCKLAAVDKQTTKWLGSALLPQAGVAIGMALVASNYFPDYENMLLAVVIGATIVFELIGPVFTKLAIHKVMAH